MYASWCGLKALVMVTVYCVYCAGVECWNPAFDVTPAALITGGIITELGVYRPHELKDALMSAQKSQRACVL